MMAQVLHTKLFLAAWKQRSCHWTIMGRAASQVKLSNSCIPTGRWTWTYSKLHWLLLTSLSMQNFMDFSTWKGLQLQALTSQNSPRLSHTPITPTKAPLKTPRLFWFPSSFSSTHFYDCKMDAWYSLLDSLEPPHLWLWLNTDIYGGPKSLQLWSLYKICNKWESQIRVLS